MTVTMTINILIGVLGDFPDCEIRPAAMLGGTTLAVYNVMGRFMRTADLCTYGVASLSEEGTLTGNIVECPCDFGTFACPVASPPSCRARCP